MPHQSVCGTLCCLHSNHESSASGAISFRGHLWVHLRCGPATRSPSKRWLCQSASDHWFPPLCDSSYGALTPTPVGLSLTEHASLRWTHSCSKTRSEHLPPGRYTRRAAAKSLDRQSDIGRLRYIRESGRIPPATRMSASSWEVMNEWLRRVAMMISQETAKSLPALHRSIIVR